MSDAGQPPSVFSMYRALVGIGCVCALLIVSVYLMTGPYIAANRAAALREAIFTVLPGTQQTIPLYLAADGQLRVAESNEAATAYLGVGGDGEPVGVALEASGMGYQDLIRLLYGYSSDRGSIIGMKVLESRETPGLGDRIIKDEDFVGAFADLPVPLTADGSSVAQALSTVKAGAARQDWQIDAITGATISSRAVARIIADNNAAWIPRVQRQHEQLKRIATDEQH